MSQRETDLKELLRIIAEKDSDAVEDKGYAYIKKYPRDEEILQLLCEIFESDWHFRHEDLALSFQYIKNPIAINSLYKVAFSDFEYLNFDDNYALPRKCTWALADIGTEEAKERLKEIEKNAFPEIAAFATKRLLHWEEETGRKGQKLQSNINYDFSISLIKYKDSLRLLPEDGQRIIGNSLDLTRFRTVDYTTGQLEEIHNRYIVVYQAYKPAIARYAVEHQKLGGPDFSFDRMSWIKPNFLWMMFRCGWAEKENQESVLALWIRKEHFEEILGHACFSSFQPAYYESEDAWRAALKSKKVRLQWDPDHDYSGNKLKRKAIQLGLKDEILEKFGKELIECIMDITDFVKEQKRHIDQKQIEKLLVPKEQIITLSNDILAKQLGIEI